MENKIKCGCGSLVCKSSYSRHVQTAKHNKFINVQVAELIPEKTNPNIKHAEAREYQEHEKRVKAKQPEKHEPPTTLTLPNKNFLAMITGKRNSGKSHLTRWIIYHLTQQKRFQWFLVISPTGAFNGEWDSVGKKNVIPSVSPEWLETLMTAQAKLIKKKKPCDGCIIIDDGLGSFDFTHKSFLKMCCNGRHYNSTVMAIFQHMHKAPTFVRSQADMIFTMNRISEKVATSMYEEYVPSNSDVNNWKDLQAFGNNANIDHGALLVDNTQGKATLIKIRAPAVLPKFLIKHR